MGIADSILRHFFLCGTMPQAELETRRCSTDKLLSACAKESFFSMIRNRISSNSACMKLQLSKLFHRTRTPMSLSKNSLLNW